MLAACWLQFQNHDWFSHGDNSETEFIQVPLAPSDEWDDGVMEVRRTAPDSTNAGGDLPPTYVNKVTPWWDGSQLYGSTEERNRELRAGEDGKLKMVDGRLPEETNSALHGVDLTGFSDNWWAGLAVMHTLFANEHNAICDMLQGPLPDLGRRAALPQGTADQRGPDREDPHGRVDARDSRHEGAPDRDERQLVRRDAQVGQEDVRPHRLRRADLRGSSGRRLTTTPPRTRSPSEFVSVYRMHPLIPDDYELRSHKTGEVISTTDFTPIQGHDTRKAIDEYGMSDWIYSLGLGHPGAITLHNHPNALRNLVRVNGDHVDIATIDILRDRERGVPRYNDFRQRLRKRRVEKFEDLTPNPEWNEQIREVYGGDIDKVDTQVGMLGEKIPPGFGFSDTAFRIFILMASRRLKSDRFFTNDYTPRSTPSKGSSGLTTTSSAMSCAATIRSWRRRSRDRRTRSRRGGASADAAVRARALAFRERCVERTEEEVQRSRWR